MDSGALKNKIASFAIVWCLVFSMFAGVLFLGVANVGKAALPSYLPNGDVIIGSDYEVSTWNIDGSIHYMDGNLTIRAGGVVHVMNGGIAFTQDCGIADNPSTSTHVYTLVIEDGGQLILDNSTLTTHLNQIYNFPSLGVLVQNGGVLSATDSVLQFPGHLVVDHSTMELTRSVVCGHNVGDISSYCDPNFFPSHYFDSSPVLFFSSSNIFLQDSRIQDIFYNATGPSGSIYSHQYAFASDTASRDDVTYTLSRTPTGFAADNTVSDPIGNMSSADQKFATIAPGEVLSTNLNALYGLLFDNAATVTMHVRYMTDHGYAAANVVNWGFRNGALNPSSIVIDDTSAVYNPSINSFKEESVVLPAMTSEDLYYLQVRLANTAGSQNIYVDRVWFTVQFDVDAYKSVSVAMNSRLTAINSYIGVDFSDNGAMHNTLNVYDSSQCYLYGTSFDMQDTASQTYLRQPAVWPMPTATGLDPLAKSPSDNTNALIRNITVSGDTLYATVGGGRVLSINAFNGSDLSGLISAATLNFAYLTNGAGAPTNYIKYGIGTASLNTPIRPRLSASLTTDSFNLFAAGITSLDDIKNLNVTYQSVAGQANVLFDRIWITVTLKPTVSIYRWANVTVLDSQGLPVSGATVDPTTMLQGEPAQYYSASGVSTVPPAEVLAYLGKTAGNYLVTNSAGSVIIPLLSEFINDTSMPNSNVVGDYLLTAAYINATFVEFDGYAGVSFTPYPAMGVADQTVDINIVIDTLILDRPDLTPTSLTTLPATVYINDMVTVSAVIADTGLTGANSVFVQFYDGGQLISNYTIPSIAPSGSEVATVQWNAFLPGMHTITVVVDPLNAILEKSKTNNERSIQVNVLLNLPDLAITSASISFSPQPAWTHQPVTAFVNVSNIGRMDAINVTVAYYVGDPASVGQLIGTSLVNVSQGATVQTHLTWQPSQIGTYDIYVVVNPAKDIPEYSYANNEASASITVNLTILQFDVVVDGTNTFVFSDPTFNLRGNIIVKDSGTLIIDSSTLVIFQHQDEEFQIYVMDSGTFEMRNSTLTSNYQITMNLLDDGALTMTHSTISAMVKTIADDDSTVVATNSNIGGDVVAPSTSSAVLDIRYSVMSQPLTDFGGNSQATLVSVSVPAAQPKENAIVYNFRTINVLVNDGAGNPLPGADVSVWWYSNKTLYTSGITGASGTISFPALSDVITAFSSNFFGNYLVNATFSTYMSGKAIAALLPYSEPLNVADVSLTLTVGPALPALSIAASDISLSPALLYTGQIAVVNATVHNGGVVDARNVLVRLFADGLPVVDVVLADVPAGGSAVASFSWVPALPGDHELIVLVNANNAIPETDYSNNFASVTAHVEVSTAPADLVVEGNMVVTLNGTTFTYSKVVVRGNGQLFITNGGLNINQPVPGSFSIFVQDNGQLNIANAAINSNQQIWMQVSGSAKVNIQSSLVFFTVGLRLEGSSSVYVESSTIGSDVVAPTGSAATLKARNTTFLSAWSSFGGDAKAYLTNVTIPKIALTGNAIAYNYRWIAVTVVDGTNAALPNATVLLKWYVNGTVAGTKISDSQGKALFEALGDILTPTTAPAFYGNYKVNATFVFEGQSFNVSWTPVSLDPYSEPLSPLSKAVTLKVDGARPDLDPPLLVNPPSPFKGDNVTLTSIVKNVGVVPARNVIVRFTDDTNIVADVIIPKIVPHQIVQVSTIWVPQTLGVHNVSVILDPVGAIPELNKNNNVNWTLVNVRGKPDLAFSASDIVITPSSPVTNSSATISVTVINQGDASAVGAIVRFLQTPPGGAIRFIGNNTLSTMAAGESRTSVMSFGPTAPGTYMITIRVSVPGQPDKNVSVPLTVRDYPDLAATAIDLSPSSVNVGDQLTMSATVTNVGQSSASNVLVYFWLGNTGTGTLIDQTTIPLINAGETLQAVGQWIVTANSAGKIQTRTVTVQVDPFNAIRKIGHAVGVFSLSFDVLDMRPDLAFSSNVTVVGGATPITEAPIGQNVTISVDVHNSGYSAANNVMIEFRINDADNLNRTIGSLTHTIMANQTYEASIAWVVDAAGPGNFTLWVTLDPLHLIDEVSTTNNVAHTNFTIKPADVSIDVTLPSGTDYQQGSNIFITGYIKNQRTLSPLVNRTVSVFITDLSGQTQYGVMVSTMSTSLGWYGVSVHVPDTLDQGAYNLKVIVDMGTTHPSSQAQISVSPAAVETSMPFWVWLVIILAVVAIILFFSIYLYRYGLGKMVECGECGALIPESSKRCPKCGTQFETGTAKCSQCSAWIPVTSTECPECGAKFVAGPIAEEEDEHVKAMRQQYEVFVDTYREQAKGVLGKKFNEKRFMEWWKNQPSYISFERWLSQEDEKRAVATSITCPTCGTLNPRDSTICQKCGTVFDQKPAAPEAAAEEQRPLRRIVRRPAEKKLIPRKEAKPEEQAPQQPAQPSEPQGPEQPKNP